MLPMAQMQGLETANLKVTGSITTIAKVLLMRGYISSSNFSNYFVSFSRLCL